MSIFPSALLSCPFVISLLTLLVLFSQIVIHVPPNCIVALAAGSVVHATRLKTVDHRKRQDGGWERIAACLFTHSADVAWSQMINTKIPVGTVPQADF